MRRQFAILLVLVLTFAAAAPAAATDRGDGTPTDARTTQPGLAALRALGLDADEPAIAIATHREPATETIAAGLADLGLEVQPLRHIPATLLYGPAAALIAAAEVDGVVDVYPDEQVELHSRESTAAINADVTRELGYDGRDVTVAIVDSGVDCTHADLAGRCIANYKMVGPEYLADFGVPVEHDSGPGTLAIPVDEGPYSNSDLGGHGTHVAGIVAGEGSNDPELVGVAPGANLVGYGTGDVLFIFIILGAYDHILEHRDELGIQVVNNSWGSRFRTFDPGHPTNLGSRALHDSGIVVVQSAGNSDEEMTLNPWATPPWVIGSASATIAGERSGFSSSGLRYDNALPVGVDDDGHIRFTGDRLGIYMPDVSAPGSSIVSTATPTGVFPGPGSQDGKVSASGTSMSAPHHSGLAAVILQAARESGHELSPFQVKQVMRVTAGPMADGSEPWRSGFGFVDAAAAVELVTSRNFSAKRLERLHDRAVEDVLADRDYAVTVSDHWFFEAATPATVGGVESYQFDLEVEDGTDAFRATAAFGSTLGLLGLNEFVWDLEVRDADGQLLATSTTSGANGLSVLEVDLTRVGDPEEEGDQLPGLPEDVDEVAFGTWTLDVIGTFAVNDAPLLYSPPVSVAAVQLVEQQRRGAPEQEFIASGELGLLLTPTQDPVPLQSAEGCAFDEVPAEGGMTLGDPADECRAALGGYATSINVAASRFVSEPIPDAVTVGGTAELVLHVADEVQPAWSTAFASRILYTIDAIGPDGEPIAITGGEALLIAAPAGERGVYELDVPTTDLPAGSEVRLSLEVTGFYTSAMRLLYGGEFDSGLTFMTGSLGRSGQGDAERDQESDEPEVQAADRERDDDEEGKASAEVLADGRQLPATGGGAGLLGVLAVGIATAGTRRR